MRAFACFVFIVSLHLVCGDFLCEDVWTARECQNHINKCITSKNVQLNCLRSCGSCTCGQPSVQPINPIINGDDAPSGAWPWQVGLIDQDDINSGDYDVFCGGTLISNWWVVTATHCVDEYIPGVNLTKLNVALGFNDIDSFASGLQNDPEKMIVKVKRLIHFNDNWAATGKYSGDISLLELDQAVPNGRYIQQACLPRITEDPPVGTRCYTTGWGRWEIRSQNGNFKYPDELQQLEQYFISKQTCLGNRNRYFRQELRRQHPTQDDFICGGKVDPHGKLVGDACMGDSGGPYVCDVGGHWELHGVVSWGVTNDVVDPAGPVCNLKGLGVYTRVNSFRKFIYDTLYPPKCYQRLLRLSYYEKFKKKMRKLGITP